MAYVRFYKITVPGGTVSKMYWLSINKLEMHRE